MSLYGSLYSSVAGLRGQSNKVGVISDNIANVNTVGYKQTQAGFESLVTNSGLASIYSPGGVLSQNRALISKQGLVQGTDTATDIAIAGRGFFVVQDSLESDASTLYTRSGAFRQDSLGNFRNTAGFYLLGWPLDREGRLPGEPGNLNTNSINNLTSLEPINVLTATGTATETTKVELSANLTASETIYPGAEATADMDALTVNEELPAKTIIVPGYLDGTALTGNINSIERGDKFRITSGSGLSYTYRYGGFTYSRNISTAANGDSGQGLRASPLTLLANPFATTNTSKTVTVTAANHGLSTGDVVTLSGQAATLNGIPASDFNQKFVVTVTTADAFTIQVSTAATATGSGGTTGLSLVTRPFAGNILDSTSSTSRFLATTGTSSFNTSSLSFTITTETTGTVTFTYTNSTANAQLKQFNTLENLADAINAVTGLSARVSGNRLYVGAVDANEAVTFANGSVTGTGSGTSTLAGIDWVREIGLENIAAGESRFNSLESLEELVNASSGLTGTLNNPLTEATLDINIEDPLDTISFTDLPASSALTAFTTATPFSTTISSKTVTVTHPSPHGLTSGDVVTLNPTSFTGYPSTSSATNAFTTTNASTTVTVTKTAHGYVNGQVIFIDPSSVTGYPTGFINGVPISSLEGNFTIANVTANTFDITVDSAANATGAGGAGNFLASPTFNGIPYSDFNGRFEVTVTGPSTYTVQVVHAATSTGATGATGLIVTPPNNRGSVLAELGLVTTLNGAAYTVQSLGPLGPEYAATDSDKNMAGGEITPQFSQNLRIYDALGSGHDLKVAFIKVAVNTWAAEIFATDDTEVTASLANGLLGYGTLTFNGDGSLRSVSSGLSNEIAVTWANGATAGAVTFNWGTAGEPFGTTGATVIGKTDGMTQFDAVYRVNFVNQNGAAVGQLVSVTFTEEGFVVANYNNGESQQLYKVPIADFSNPDQMQAISGNVYTQTNDSGEPNLREAGTSGAGKIQSSALETSNVELADQLTDLIVAQRAYQANTKLITTADNLLEELNNTLR